jgi:hypothetical protein
MSPPTSGAPARQLLATHAEYVQCFDLLLALATRELRIFDPTLARLELESPARAGQLAAFLEQGAHVRLMIALHDPAPLLSRMPRLRRLCALFTPQVEIRQTLAEAARAQDCFVIADLKHLVRRPVASQPRGAFLCGEPQEAALYRERFDAIWESSEPTASVTTLGL